MKTASHFIACLDVLLVMYLRKKQTEVSKMEKKKAPTLALPAMMALNKKLRNILLILKLKI
ncbi:MAG: hypothetical protein COT80_00370 [Candidatus Buchananbacteria bacterium CG10_big_fil_rev_8_21_14_0_10_33_19]|uniref:Uncharacterized protein n=1 Tax=Candidatus Buchananbacteria bacterium CG10_big_fil_rev_8_21_14_0_10_33_19 TaxID=1974525 RepID=A0A2H0W583_9BACT|nr:MAG: hypothetical protein COT80_00370 [Candidatus Buchananbacteria bacterium CG10_big_fil_rev_8_21_14_0_10_33_19]